MPHHPCWPGTHTHTYPVIVTHSSFGSPCSVFSSSSSSWRKVVHCFAFVDDTTTTTQRQQQQRRSERRDDDDDNDDDDDDDDRVRRKRPPTLTLTHSLTHLQSLAHSHSLTVTHSQSLSHSLTVTHSLTHSHCCMIVHAMLSRIPFIMPSLQSIMHNAHGLLSMKRSVTDQSMTKQLSRFNTLASPPNTMQRPTDQTERRRLGGNLVGAVHACTHAEVSVRFYDDVCVSRKLCKTNENENK